MRLYLWYSSSSGEAVQERISVIMSPPTPKKDEDLAGVLESWLKEVRLIEDLGQGCELPFQFKITTFKIILGNKRDRFDHITQSLRAAQASEEETTT